jgi:hypothetical protein
MPLISLLPPCLRFHAWCTHCDSPFFLTGARQAVNTFITQQRRSRPNTHASAYASSPCCSPRYHFAESYLPFSCPMHLLRNNFGILMSLGGGLAWVLGFVCSGWVVLGGREGEGSKTPWTGLVDIASPVSSFSSPSSSFCFFSQSRNS